MSESCLWCGGNIEGETVLCASCFLRMRESHYGDAPHSIEQLEQEELALLRSPGFRMLQDDDARGAHWGTVHTMRTA